METQINVTGELQESGVYQVREALQAPPDTRGTESTLTHETVLEQGSSVIAPGPAVPLPR